MGVQNGYNGSKLFLFNGNESIPKEEFMDVELNRLRFATTFFCFPYFFGSYKYVLHDNFTYIYIYSVIFLLKMRPNLKIRHPVFQHSPNIQREMNFSISCMWKILLNCLTLIRLQFLPLHKFFKNITCGMHINICLIHF